MHKSLSKQEQYFELPNSEAASSNIANWFVSFAVDAKRNESPGCYRTTAAEDLAWKLLEELPEGIVVTRLDRRIVFANQVAKKLFGIGDDCLDARQEIVLPESGTVNVFLDGEEKSLDITSRIIKHERQALIMSMVRDTTDTHKQLERLAQQCFTDELTGLYNRRGFLAIAQHQIDSARRQRRRIIAIFADMDGLKEINDRLGHKAGDRAIKDLADLLSRSFRAEDVIARLGGDEFVILTTIEAGQNAQAVIDRLRKGIDRFNHRGLRNYTVQASFGFEVIDPNATADLEEVIQRADSEMYCEKRKRRMEKSKAG